MPQLLAWLGFFLSIATILLVSRKNLAVSMFLGALILGIFTLSLEKTAEAFYSVFTDLPTVLLALAVALIPIIGGTLKTSGQMDDLINNLRIGKKTFLAVSPALIGMLPMPGGALLSAPLVEKGGKGISNEKKVGLNVWFRHVLYLVYPLSPSLIVAAKVAKLDVFQVIPYLALLLLFSLILGYLFFLRDVPGRTEYEEKFSLKKLLPPFAVIFVAPILDLLLEDRVSPEEVATLIAVVASLVLAITTGRVSLRRMYNVTRESKPWNFALMIFGIMTFLYVFTMSSMPELIAGTEITPEILSVVLGFLLGFGTGRIVTPAGVIIPIFLTKFGPISPAVFAITYFSIFLGYALTPVHPCVSLTAEFFKVKIKDFLRVTAPPALIALVICFFLLFSVNI
ncbi:MAG: DUF401 family protein [Candidatus Bathyarchaeia archaeon]